MWDGEEIVEHGGKFLQDAQMEAVCKVFDLYNFFSTRVSRNSQAKYLKND